MCEAQKAPSSWRPQVCPLPPGPPPTILTHPKPLLSGLLHKASRAPSAQGHPSHLGSRCGSPGTHRYTGPGLAHAASVSKAWRWTHGEGGALGVLRALPLAVACHHGAQQGVRGPGTGKRGQEAKGVADLR